MCHAAATLAKSHLDIIYVYLCYYSNASRKLHVLFFVFFKTKGILKAQSVYLNKQWFTFKDDKKTDILFKRHIHTNFRMDGCAGKCPRWHQKLRKKVISSLVMHVYGER
jgi:hypothetical protein